MPTKEGLPAANIAVRLSDSFYPIGEGISEYGIEVVEIPRAGLSVNETSSKVGSIDRRAVGEGFPELR